MDYSFNAFGHKNILATHKTTLAFTKDKELTKRGDCIIGINSDFQLEYLKKFLKKFLNKQRVRFIISINGEKFGINARINSSFQNDNDIVIRKTDFISTRTLAISSDKSAIDVPRHIIKLLQNNKQAIRITISAILKLSL